MLSAGESKVNGKVSDPLAPKPMKAGVNEDFLDTRTPEFKTINDLPQCEFEGAPEIKTVPDTYLEDPQQLWILRQDDVKGWQINKLKDFLLEYRKDAYTKEGRPFVIRLPVALQKKLINGTQEEKKGALKEGVEWLYGQMQSQEFEDFKEAFASIFPEKQTYPYSVFLPPGEFEKLHPDHPFKKLTPITQNNPESQDDIFRSIQASRGNFDFTDSNIFGDSAKKFHLCRNGDGSKIYASKRNRYLENKEGKNTALFSKANGFPHLSYQKRVLLPIAAGISPDNYYYEEGYSDASAELYMQTGSATALYQIRAYIENLKRSQKFTPSEIEQITDAMLNAAQALIEAEEKQNDQLFWMQFGGILGAANIVLFGGFFGYQAYKQRSIEKVNPKDFLVDNTAIASSTDYAQIVLDEEIEEIINLARAATRKVDKRHIVFTGPSGGGKDLIAAEFERRVVQGKIPHLKGKRIFQLDAKGVAAAGAIWAGLIDKVLHHIDQTFRKANGIFRVSELQNLLDTGKSSSTSTGALRKLLTMLERPGTGSIFVGTTSEWDKILAEVPDIDRRVTPIVVPTPTFAKVLNILTRSADRFLNQGQSGVVALEQKILEAIAHFAKLRTGSENAIALETLDLLSAQAADRKDSRTGALRITMDDVYTIAKNDAQKLGIPISRGNFDQALAFFNQHPDLERPYFREALNLVAQDKNPSAIFQAGFVPRSTGAPHQEMETLAKLLQAVAEEEGPASPPPTRRGPPPIPPPQDPPMAGGAATGGSDSPVGDKTGSSSGGKGGAQRLALKESTLLDHAIGPALLGMAAGGIVAEHYGVISQEQLHAGEIGMLAGTVAANPALVLEAAPLLPAFLAGDIVYTTAMEAVGVDTNSLGYKLGRFASGILSAEASALALGKFVAQKLPEYANRSALHAGHQFAQDSAMNIARPVVNWVGQTVYAAESAVASSVQTARQGMQLYGNQVVGTAQNLAAQARVIAQDARATLAVGTAGASAMTGGALTYVKGTASALLHSSASIGGAEATMTGAPGFATVGAMSTIVGVSMAAIGGYTLGNITNNKLENFSEEQKLGTALDLGTYDLPANASEKYKRGNWTFIPDEN